MEMCTYTLILLSLLSLSNAAHISILQPPVCEGATLVHDYKGSLPVEKLQTGDHVHIISSEITVGNEETIFPNLLHVAVEKCYLKGEFQKFLKAMPSVNKLVLEKNDIENFKIEDLSLLNNLEVLRIQDQHVGNLKAEAFSKFRNLKELYLVSGEIDHIDDKAFDQADNLQVLDLSRNNLKSLSDVMLSPLKNIKHLNLNHNHLEKLTAEQLPHLPELELIDVEGNRFTDVNIEDLRTKCPKLRTVQI